MCDLTLCIRMAGGICAVYVERIGGVRPAAQLHKVFPNTRMVPAYPHPAIFLSVILRDGRT